MKKLMLLVGVFVLTSPTLAAQDNYGSVTGRVTLRGAAEGIAGAQVSLEGPISPTLDGRYTPNPALTPAMREEIEALIASAPFAYPQELLALNTRRREALLLGLPDPGPSPATTRTPPPQVNTQSDNAGSFSFRNLAPGEYLVFAWETVQNNAWTNAEFLAPYESRGQRITVKPGASANVDVQVIQ